MKLRNFVELTALDMVDMFQMSFLGVIITSIIFYLYKTVMRNKINSYFDKEDIHTLIIIIIIKIFISLLIIMFIKKTDFWIGSVKIFWTRALGAFGIVNWVATKMLFN